MANTTPKDGTRPKRNRLAPEQEQQIIARAATERLEALAVEYQVHYNTVRNILRRAKTQGGAA